MPRKQKKYHHIYKTTNVINNKYYVGVHSTDDLDDGYIGSGKYLWNSIRKHGRENFRCEILEFFDSRDELVGKEIELVNEGMLNDPLCMNLKCGGYGGFCNEEHREKFLESAKRTQGSKIWQKAGRDEFSKLMKNEKFHKLHCEKMKIVNNRPDTGFNNKKHTIKSKEKIGLTNSIKQKGTKNSQYGTCWVTKNGINKKIKNEILDLFILDGWIKGRKMST